MMRKLKELLKAIYPYVLKRKSYSQHGEDTYIAQVLSSINSDNINYVDVGCNHPMKISNSYLFYRNGASGVCIDANKRFGYLYKLFRSRDLFISVGVGAKSELAKFYTLGTHVLSGFKNFSSDDSFEFVPVLTLDEILKNIDIRKISILTIDVEGLNIEVLKGATNTLKMVDIICIEFDDIDEKSQILEMLKNDFDLIEELFCNLILKRRNLN